jgi:S1-C subfamily serine protease
MLKLLLGPALPLALLLIPALPDPEPDPRGRGYLGVQINTVADTRVTIQSVVADGPAARAGLRNGDVLLKVDKEEVKDVPGTIRTISSMKPGTALELLVERDGKKLDIRMKVGTRPIDLDPPPFDIPPPPIPPKSKAK